jgi:hypothetical protein
MEFNYEFMNNNNNSFVNNHEFQNHYFANLKRKAWHEIDDSDYTNSSSSDSEDTGEFTDVVRRMKRIKFPVFIVIKVHLIFFLCNLICVDFKRSLYFVGLGFK